ncbi:MAG: UdgX family uracil-DNA binding protein [Geminicoccaceae bacterium]|nr:UdgX family uracil-DNA binding protein [Geminicoccaceae bacterium]
MSEAALEDLREEAKGCTRCPLYGPATQTVFGEGPVAARLMLIGEAPGDQEDRKGRPFVGPAGQLLENALAEVGIARGDAYLTNAVKHFKFEMKGRRRIHQKPDPAEMKACHVWLEREIDLVDPDLIVAMGATAARAVFNRVVTIGKTRGRLHEVADGRKAFVTVHPSYLLRLPDEAAKAVEYARFLDELRQVRAFLEDGVVPERAAQTTLL